VGPPVSSVTGSVVTAPADRARFPDDPGAAPATRREALVWMALAVVGFAVGQVAALVLVAAAAAVAGKSAQLSAIAKLDAPPEWYVFSSLIGLWIGFGGAAWLAGRRGADGRPWAALGLGVRWIDSLGLLIGVGGQFLVALAYAPFINHLHNFSAPAKKLTGSAHGWSFFAIAVFTVIGAPFFEELFFRGVLLRGLVRFMASLRAGGAGSPVAALGCAAIGDGLLFGLAHGELVQLAGLALFGTILALVVLRTGRLGMAIVSHASFNLIAIVTILYNRGGVVL
jgi:membrane protease YdiL (CAAX protease family)